MRPFFLFTVPALVMGWVYGEWYNFLVPPTISLIVAGLLALLVGIWFMWPGLQQRIAHEEDITHAGQALLAALMQPENALLLILSVQPPADIASTFPKRTRFVQISTVWFVPGATRFLHIISRVSF